MNTDSGSYFPIAVSFLGDKTQDILGIISKTRAVFGSLVLDSIASDLAFDDYVVFTSLTNLNVRTTFLAFSFNMNRCIFDICVCMLYLNTEFS